MKNEQILDSKSINNTTIEIVQMSKLEGASSPAMCSNIFFIEHSNAALKFVRIKMDGTVPLKTETGALYYASGKIENNLQVGGVKGAISKVAKSVVTKETAFNPEYTGTGVIVLEPTFKHFIIVGMDNDSFIVDKGCYYCSVGNIDVKPAMQSNVSSAAFGGEGIFQTKISGSGIVVLEIPVPMSEIEVINLNGEQLQVDGNFAILRESSIKFSVGKSSKKLIGTMLSGEGLLNKFEGTGMVWLAPTAPVYTRMQNMASLGLDIMGEPSKNRNNKQ